LLPRNIVLFTGSKGGGSGGNNDRVKGPPAPGNNISAMMQAASRTTFFQDCRAVAPQNKDRRDPQAWGATRVVTGKVTVISHLPVHGIGSVVDAFNMAGGMAALAPAIGALAPALLPYLAAASVALVVGAVVADTVRVGNSVNVRVTATRRAGGRTDMSLSTSRASIDDWDVLRTSARAQFRGQFSQNNGVSWSRYGPIHTASVGMRGMFIGAPQRDFQIQHSGGTHVRVDFTLANNNHSNAVALVLRVPE